VTNLSNDSPSLSNASPPAGRSATDRPPDLSDELEALARNGHAPTATPTDTPTDTNGLVTVAFELPADVHASSASVVGDFNDWNPNDGVMQRGDDGSFTCTLAIPAGRTYQYRFLLDGDRWTNNWAAHAYAPNAFGGEDSVLDLTDGSPDHDTGSAQSELEAQRDVHQSADGAGATERPDDGMAPLINNTGDDGGAATG
jgi:hypothetical protein